MQIYAIKCLRGQGFQHRIKLPLQLLQGIAPVPDLRQKHKVIGHDGKALAAFLDAPLANTLIHPHRLGHGGDRITVALTGWQAQAQILALVVLDHA